MRRIIALLLLLLTPSAFAATLLGPLLTSPLDLFLTACWLLFSSVVLFEACMSAPPPRPSLFRLAAVSLLAVLLLGGTFYWIADVVANTHLDIEAIPLLPRSGAQLLIHLSLLFALGTGMPLLTILLAGIASISLVVGGIGIMNIMLVSVRERTREIGIRKAIGARGRDILAQFLVEALTLSVLGGLIGVVLGVAVSAAIGQIAGWGFQFQPMTVLVAVGFSLLVGVVFGVWPARQAARLDPIVALRYE